MPSEGSSRSQCVVLTPVASHIEPTCEKGLAELEVRGYSVRRVRGYSAVDQARNQMATDALAAGFLETMWIDSDIGFFPDDVDRLRELDLPMVCGIYPKKGRRELACCALPDTRELTFGQQGGLVEILYAGAGFLHVRREVYETMQQTLPLPVCNENLSRPLVPYFMPMVVEESRFATEVRRELPQNEAVANTRVFPRVKPGPAPGDGRRYLAEDFAFCERARACGYAIWADTRIRLAHFGSYPYAWEDAGGTLPRYSTYRFGVLGELEGEGDK